MEFLKQKILLPIACRIDIRKLIDYSGEHIIHLFYHTVSNIYLPHISPLYKPKTINEFKNDIEFLLKYFHPVSINDFLLHMQEGKQFSTPSFHLTFDDGLRQVYDYVLPVLYEKGIPATIFVNSKFVDNQGLFYRYKQALIVSKLRENKLSGHSDEIFQKILNTNHINESILDETARELDIDFNEFLKKEKPYLSVDELRELQQKGFTIGGHSETHPKYGLLTEKEQVSQTLNSCSYVQDVFGEKNKYFAFPFTDEGISQSVFSKIHELVDLTFGLSGINTTQHGRHIARIDMEKYGKNAKECIHRAYLTQILKKWI